MLAFITGLAGHETRESQLINNYSGNNMSDMKTGISSNDSTLQADRLWVMIKENDSTETSFTNNLRIMPAIYRSEKKESKNLPPAQIKTDGCYFSLFQSSIIPVFQISCYPL
jgi:hypothetical protein